MSDEDKNLWLFSYGFWNLMTSRENHLYIGLLMDILFRSRFLGCQKKQLLTSEQHSFSLFDQSYLSFYFREPRRAKFTILNLSNQRSFFYLPITWWESLKSHVFHWDSRLRASMLTRSLQCRKLSSRRTISSLMCPASLICRNHLSKICLAWTKASKQLDFNHVEPERLLK